MRRENEAEKAKTTLKEQELIDRKREARGAREEQGKGRGREREGKGRVTDRLEPEPVPAMEILQSGNVNAPTQQSPEIHLSVTGIIVVIITIIATTMFSRSELGCAWASGIILCARLGHISPFAVILWITHEDRWCKGAIFLLVFIFLIPRVFKFFLIVVILQ